MKRQIFLLFLSVLLSSSLFADNVTVEQAQTYASKFFQADAQTRGSSPQLQLVWDGSEANTRVQGSDAPALYVFNRTDAKGFVIVSGDDIAMPVLGYSFKHNFEGNRIPCNVQYWLESLEDQINYARTHHAEASADTKAAWTRPDGGIGEVVTQLETAQWNQDAPYNDMCPIVNGQRSVTGCVATAIAIIMRYHQWPDRGVGTIGNYRNGGDGQMIEAIELGHEYDWENMPLDYTNSTPEQDAAVAQLMYECGVMSEASYSPQSTGALHNSATAAMSDHMKYDKSQRTVVRTSGDAAWNELMRTEIVEYNRPILYSGVSRDGTGHEFVVDAYTTNDYFGLNWGWGGSYNGYFLLSALNPSGAGIGGGSGAYNYNQMAVINLKPDEGGEEVLSIVLQEGYTADNVYYGGISTEETSFEVGQPFMVTCGFMMNLGISDFTGDFALGHVNRAGELKEIVAEYDFVAENGQALPTSMGVGFSRICTITQPIEIGDYICAYYRGDGEEAWTRAEVAEGTVGQLPIADAQTLAEASTLAFNRMTRLLTIETKLGVAYRIINAESGAEMAAGVVETPSEENPAIAVATIDASQWEAGSYQLVLTREADGDTKTIILKLGASAASQTQQAASNSTIHK